MEKDSSTASNDETAYSPVRPNTASQEEVIATTLQEKSPANLLPEKYLNAHQIARGGMGAILKAHDETLGREIAIKVLRDGCAVGDMEVRFRDEARITGQLEHPNIVPVHESGLAENGTPYYTMKMVEGVTLREIIQRLASGDPEACRSYSLSFLLNSFQKICDGVGFAHSRGVLHRDLKPDNIMLGMHGEVLVMDWGLAKIIQKASKETNLPPGSATSSKNRATSDLVGEAPSVARRAASSVSTSRGNESEGEETRIGSVLGTPTYMSPEQASGQIDRLDARSDIYSLGSLLHEMLTLKPAIQGKNPAQILRHVIQGNTTRISLDSPAPHCPGNRIPPSLAAVATKCMALDPNARYASVKDVQREVALYQNGFATLAENAGLARHVGLLLRRHKLPTAILAASLIVLVIGLIFYVTNLARERDATERALAKAALALADLHASAPAYFGQALDLIGKQKLEVALDKLDTALTLQPENAEFRLVQAHVLQTLLRLTEARDAYQRVLDLRPHDPAALLNLGLCNQILEANNEPDTISLADQRILLTSLVAQRRTSESTVLARKLGDDENITKSLIASRLKMQMENPSWYPGRLVAYPDGFYSLNLRGLPIPDFRILADLPLRHLSFAQQDAPDLTPLAKLPLEFLGLQIEYLSDISALRPLRLNGLHLRWTRVSDISALSEMPLVDILDITGSPIADLSPLKGKSLRVLLAANAIVRRDYSPIRGMPLEKLNVAGGYFNDLTILEGMPLTWLDLWKSNIVDLTPLINLTQLAYLRVTDNPITSLDPILGLPLVEIYLLRTKIKDVSPLAAVKTLESIALPEGVAGVESLRSLPRLKRISYEHDEKLDQPAHSAAEFWAEFDAKKNPAVDQSEKLNHASQLPTL